MTSRRSRHKPDDTSDDIGVSDYETCIVHKFFTNTFFPSLPPDVSRETPSRNTPSPVNPTGISDSA